ncbi:MULTISPECIES: pyridoxal phosphate-dependent aminotransferase [Gardnerella]|uniref:alanine transaminase n=1 Tax=Gardnerella swidsinskii TaxID=2792979 RepID=A0A9X7FEV2_9BIFI|nr:MULTISPECIES: pyridoxal phosphate-dependent aminotransferase [Gardnerella]NSX40980.1 pyridoxal phosphate-dependent aminotransferase [Gardnerella vaginalis]RIY30036.1 pyridoxal phosphate-dependent aminotransferase [Bifidobacteriaceae bacterium NR016]CPR92498.1 putative aminotransferase [Chlamydia trachomatis]PMC51208.1 pyridoxal phosphate-dependent aminotransferase [Gardnerella vaginalis]PMC53732.1 pyridoxal phosphate-dependent aminotransferase [Gardnerella vaginalis]
MRFSSRVDVSEPNPIILAQRKAIFNGVKLTKLNDSNPTSHGLAPQCLSGRYTADPRGPKEIRDILSNFINKRDNRTEKSVSSKLNPDQLYVLSSTSQAYAWLMMLLCDAGDAVMGPTPGYPLIESIARLQCVNAIPYPLHYDGSWTIDIARVRELLEDVSLRIKALVLINPNNPTGSYVKPEEREILLQLCRDNGVAIIADEVFYEYSLEPFAGNARLAGESSTLVFALDGFSKMLAAPHAKVGWIEVSGPKDDVYEAQKRLDVIADDFLPIGNTVSERIPELLQYASSQSAIVRNRVINNLHTLRETLASTPKCCVSALRAEGGWNILLRVPSCIDDDVLALRLMKDYNLVSQPGYYFDMPVNGYLALSLLPEPQQFISGLHALLRTVDALLEE